MTDAGETGRHGHVFRPGPFHRRRAYWLDGGVLHWRIGAGPGGHVAVGDIAAMRLNLAEGTGGAARCVLVERSGRVHRICDRYWPGWTRAERHAWGRLQRRNATFRALTLTLARRLHRANPSADFRIGPSRTEWIATCVVAALCVAVLAGGLALMIASGSFDLAALAFMGMAAVYLPMLWPVIRSGGPRPADPATVQDDRTPRKRPGG